MTRIKQSERDEFIAELVKEDVPLPVIRRVLSWAATIQRLAAAECNGDWPCDNGERTVIACVRCEMGYVPSQLQSGVCPSCRAGDRVHHLLAPYGIQPVIQSDPRGACVKLKLKSGKTNDWGNTGFCVPTPYI